MCLRLKNNCKTPLIANKDIIVYKVGYVEVSYKYFNLIKIHCFRPYCYQSFIYYKNKKTPKITLKVDKNNDVNEGYHAWLNLYEAQYSCRQCNDYIIGQFKIPKGSECYLGTNNDIVSNQIIYLGIYEQ